MRFPYAKCNKVNRNARSLSIECGSQVKDIRASMSERDTAKHPVTVKGRKREIVEERAPDKGGNDETEKNGIYYTVRIYACSHLES